MANQGNHLPLAPRPPKAPPEPENVPNDRPSKLVHLGRTPAQAKKMNTISPSSTSDMSAYGYGLGLELDGDQTAALGMDQPPPVGSTVHATVKMHVHSARSTPTVGGKARNEVGLTVTHMQVHPSGAGAHSGAPAKVTRAPGSKAAAPTSGIHVAAHVRRAPAKAAAKGPRATHSRFVKPPTVQRAAARPRK